MTEVDIEARMRGLSLHWVRVMFELRHATHDTGQRRDRVRSIREHVEHLRSLGPGAVEPVQSGVGRWTVTETWWGAR